MRTGQFVLLQLIQIKHLKKHDDFGVPFQSHTALRTTFFEIHNLVLELTNIHGLSVSDRGEKKMKQMIQRAKILKQY